jgi:hypothetical protein
MRVIRYLCVHVKISMIIIVRELLPNMYIFFFYFISHIKILNKVEIPDIYLFHFFHT